MLTPETLKRIRRIELRTRRLVNNSFAGTYQSVFKGRGIAFDAVRPYQPGDDVRDIDWNVTARADEAFVKRYTEERELTVMLLVDSSASCMFGTADRQKRDLAAEIGAVLALAAIKNNDEVGLLIFSDQIEHYIAPRKGRNHVLRLIRDLLAVKSSGRGTDLSLALRTVNKLLKQRAIIFLLSDFMATPADYERDLLVIGRKHDLIAGVLRDPLEEAWPAVGLMRLKDAETGELRWVDTHSAQWRNMFAAQAEKFHVLRYQTLNRAGVDVIDLPVHSDYVRALTQFFQQRLR